MGGAGWGPGAECAPNPAWVHCCTLAILSAPTAADCILPFLPSSIRRSPLSTPRTSNPSWRSWHPRSPRTTPARSTPHTPTSAARPRAPTSTCRPWRRPTPSTRPCPPLCRQRWTRWPPSLAASTSCSTTWGTPRWVLVGGGGGRRLVARVVVTPTSCVLAGTAAAPVAAVLVGQLHHSCCRCCAG